MSTTQSAPSRIAGAGGPASLAHPPFRRYLLGRICGTLGYQALSVTIAWQLYKLTGSAFDLGLIGLAQFLPMLALTLVVGDVADRFDRRWIAAICQLTVAMVAATVLVASVHGWLTRELILSLVVVLGAARAFEAPALAALLPTLLTRESLPRGTAWSASTNQLAQIAGPAGAGLLLAVSIPVALASAAVLFVAAAVCVAGIRAPPQERRTDPVTLASLLTGFGYVGANRVVLGAMSLDMVAVLLASVVALLPIFAADVLAIGPSGLGLLRAAPAVGALLMSMYLARNGVGEQAGRLLLGAVIAFGAATAVFGLSRSLPLSLLALAVLGAADVVTVVIRLSMVQLNTPDDMRGRVSAVNFLFIGTSNQLGEFRAGLVASMIGAAQAAVIGGLCAIAVGLLWRRLFPELAATRSLSG